MRSGSPQPGRSSASTCPNHLPGSSSSAAGKPWAAISRPFLTPATTPWGVDPEAPGRPGYRRIVFEDHMPDAPLDAVIASLSLHHVADSATVLDHVFGAACSRRHPHSHRVDLGVVRRGDRTVVLSPRDPRTHAARCLAWRASRGVDRVRTFLDVFCRGWLHHHGLHSASTIRRALDARFVTTHDSSGAVLLPQTPAGRRRDRRAGCDRRGRHQSRLSSLRGTARPRADSTAAGQWTRGECFAAS